MIKWLSHRPGEIGNLDLGLGLDGCHSVFVCIYIFIVQKEVKADEDSKAAIKYLSNMEPIQMRTLIF